MTDERSAPLLQVRNLSICADGPKGPLDLVKNISFDLHPGEVLGLIGESGAGKSTLGMAALGYLRPGCYVAEGEVLLDGVDMLHQTEKGLGRLRGGRISYVAQSAAAAFNPFFTLLTQIGEVLRRFDRNSAAKRAENIETLLGHLGLPNPHEFARRYPHQASGGQLQRAMTAMAMAPEPQIVVFDEPTTALDVTTQLEVLATIKAAIREQGSAALYISHDLAVVSQICDRILVLRFGEQVETGTTRQIVDRPREDYTRRLLSVGHAEPKPTTSVSADEGPLLEVEGVSAAYSGVPVLEDISVKLRRGTTLALVGESGSGKSTLARVIAGLMPPTAGRIAFEGAPLPPKLGQRDKPMLRRIQMIFQTPDTALNPHQTVGQIVGRPLAFYFGLSGREKRRRVEELLAAVELDSALYHRGSTTLSGGQKQRLAIARALAAEPDCLLCDEVTASLDPLIGAGIIELLDKLRRERGVSYVFITHDLSIVQAIADDIAVMEQGRIVDYGSRREVLSEPLHPTTGLLLSSQPSTEEGWLERTFAERQGGGAPLPEPRRLIAV